MGYEESLKQFLCLTRQELQCFCKSYNLPANKSHFQLASSLALLLEKANLNSAPEREKLFGSTQASLATSSGMISNIKESSTHSKDNHKRVPSFDRDDDDRPLLHMKRLKGPQTITETSKRECDTSRSFFSPVPINNRKAECCGCSSSGPGISHMLSQSADDIAKESTTPEPAAEHPAATTNRNDQNSLELGCTAPEFWKHSVTDNGMVSSPCGHAKVGECFMDKGCVSSDKITANATPSLQFFVMSEEGINLFVDLNSTPSTWINSFKEEVCVHLDTHHSEPGNFSNFISSLVSKDEHNTISPSGNIIVDIQSKGAESITPCTNSSLGSTAGENSHLEPHPPDATAVSSRSSASTLPDALVENSGSQEGVPVVSSCLTSDIQNNMTSDILTDALDNKVLPQGSVDVSVRSERSSAPLADASVQPTGNTDTVSPAFSTGNAVRSDSDENSCPTSAGKHEIVDILTGSQLNNNGGMHEVLIENEPVKVVVMEEDTGCGDRLSVSCQLAGQTVTKLPVTDAQSDACSADNRVAGNFDLTKTTTSSTALDGATNPLMPKHAIESADSHDSPIKKRSCGPEEPEELESKRQSVCGEPTRNILLSLRSANASAKQTQDKSATLPRRSARLVTK